MAKRGGKRRDPAREKLWRRTIREQERSGLAVRAFCRREGLKDWQLPLVATRAGPPRSRDARPPPGLGDRGEPTEPRLPRLPPGPGRRCRSASRPGPPHRSRSCCNGGPTVRVPSGFDPRTLGDVLAVLEGRPC